MSIKAMNWAWEQKFPPSSKLILMSLADAADDTGECWPRVRIIAEKCCTSERTVQRVLKEFEKSGVLMVSQRFRADGAQTSNSYRLSLFTPPDNLSPPSRSSHPGGDMGDTPGVTKLCQGGGDMAVSPLEPPTEPKKKPPLQPEHVLALPSQLSASEKDTIIKSLETVPYDDAQKLITELEAAITCRKIKTTPTRWFHGVIKNYRQGKFDTGNTRTSSPHEPSNAKQPHRNLQQKEQLPITSPALAREHLSRMKIIVGCDT
ncbi:helix-turn-helix domain-containing protein [Stutzerimonas nitrititolerans]|uniref:helix-turn-helix domain-containing protein n=1 Tax=Stutzerimonas nitrititolerans TaxID=2482751 RepID=UPI0028974DC5|nr:helix-turn-helix domain-containing protein [Stutzerimonas nitrititolerans]